jgi:FtsP/CotA-like multicopper oxidase with cupredoxin domain
MLLRFGGYADPDLPYMFHGHVLQHEDRGMMRELAERLDKAAGGG